MLSIVTTKGQVTIPKKIRDALQIKPNDRVDFLQKGGDYYHRPNKDPKIFPGSCPEEGSRQF